MAWCLLPVTCLIDFDLSQEWTMKYLGLVAGLAALVAAGSAHADTIYDTLSGQSANYSYAIGSHSPVGASFNVAYTEALSSVTLGLTDKSGTCGTATVGAYCTDSGSITVYLVQGSNGMPASSGLTLTNAINLGTILDTSIAYGGNGSGPGSNPLTNITLSANVALTSGEWWIELVSTNTTAKWGLLTAATATGTVGTPTTGWYTAGLGGPDSIIGGVSSNSNMNGNGPSPNDEYFMMTVNAPEPATLSIIGAGLFGLGMIRRRKAQKTA